LAACGKLNVTYFNADAKRSIAWTNSRLSGDHLAYLEAFPFTVQDGAFAIAHGTLYYPERFGYILTALDADLCFAAHERRFAFVGHSHVPLTFAATDGDITVMTQPSVRFPDWTRAIVNVGSVGQPRDGDPRASYGLLDTDESRVEIRRIAYDVDACARKILAAGLPPSNAQRLAFGG
jgi:diadenosine tetraphosphatase ApaH/serine/threonine PP2A family protein phosphatase